MNGKTIALIIGAILLIFIGFLVFDGDEGVDVDTNGTGEVSTTTDDNLNGTGGTDTDMDTDEDGNLQVTYSTYTSEDLSYQILRPTGAQVSDEGENREKFTLLGPQNEPQTEITDGFTLTIHKDESVATSTSLLQYAQSVLQETQSSPGSDELLSELEARNVNGQSAYRFSFRNMLGSTSTAYVFLPDAGLGYTATYTVTDPEQMGYQSIVFNMLESLAFIEA